jgi:uncharacterized membrane protein
MSVVLVLLIVAAVVFAVAAFAPATKVNLVAVGLCLAVVALIVQLVWTATWLMTRSLVSVLGVLLLKTSSWMNQKTDSWQIEPEERITEEFGVSTVIDAADTIAHRIDPQIAALLRQRIDANDVWQASFVESVS